MALTDTDLANIAKLVAHEMNGKLDKKLDEKFAKNISPIHEELIKLNYHVEKLETRIGASEKVINDLANR